MNNRSAQVGRLLFHIDENCSGWEGRRGGHETMAGCHCPGREPRPSPHSCLLRSGSHSPTSPFGGLPSPRWRDFYHAFGFSLNQLPVPGYLTPTVSVSERVMRHGRGNWGVSRWPMTGGGILCFGSSQVEAAKTHLQIRTLWLQIQEQQQRSLRSLIWSAEVDLVERKQSKAASGDSLSSDIQSMLLKLRLNWCLFASTHPLCMVSDAIESPWTQLHCPVSLPKMCFLHVYWCQINYITFSHTLQTGRTQLLNRSHGAAGSSSSRLFPLLSPFPVF